MHALVPIADGVEEMEAVIVADVLRRAGWRVTLAALGKRTVVASRGVRLVADAEWADVPLEECDLLVLPGGAQGTEHLIADERVLEAIRCFAASNRTVAAICAAPLAMQAAGVLKGRRATCHPAVRGRLTEALPDDRRVVADGNLLTSQGPGTAFEFALALIRKLDGDVAADRVAAGLVLPS